MSKLNDDILNRYIDNELDSTEINDVKKVLDEDEESLKRLKALRSIDRSLREIEIYPAPHGFTEKVMRTIISKSKSAIAKPGYFFISIVSFFLFAIVTVLIAALKYSERGTAQVTQTNPLDDSVKFVKENLPLLQNFFSSDNFLMVGIVLTVILLISGFFMVESHKDFKNKLNSASR
ncbi:MAG: hypothetical protein HYS25_00585 [Ignavibacteriales bacterium]|nr:hypothetical protein [Ignavibacteriales bacterium]